MNSHLTVFQLVAIATITWARTDTVTLYWDESCPFPSSTCGLENQRIMGSYFEPGVTYIGSRQEKVVLLDSALAGSPAARIITPYIKASWKQSICLSLEYMIQDEGIEKVTVIQQDRSSTRIMYQVTGSEKRGSWRVAKMDITLRGGIVRYFIEARVKQGTPGLVMIKAFNYRNGKCKPEYSSSGASSASSSSSGDGFNNDMRAALFMRRSRLLEKYWDLQHGRRVPPASSGYSYYD